MEHLLRSKFAVRIAWCVWAVCIATELSAAESPATLGPRLTRAWERAAATEPLIVWVYLRDKGSLAEKSTVPSDVVSQRSLRRRAKVRPPDRLVDMGDMPVHIPYVEVIREHVLRVRQSSKWFNAVSVVARRDQIDALRQLGFVRHVEIVSRGGGHHDLEAHRIDAEALPSADASPTKPAPRVPLRFDYGMSLTQLEISNIPLMHSLGYDGTGVLVGHFDNGHRLLTHEVFDRLDVVASWDFVDHDIDTAPDPSDPISYGAHGIATLSVIAGFKEGRIIGPAFGAQYALARTENDATESPLEEDNWVAAIEWADSIGVDVATTSLGYRDFEDGFTDWTWSDMDGNTTAITRAADMAVARGIVVVVGTGNAGLNNDPNNSLLAPSDGDSVISVGAVSDTGAYAAFSSYGPTADGRTKPDVLAHGSGTAIAQTGNERHYGSGFGTSLATPIVAGAAALLLQAHPWATPLQIRDALRLTASRADAVDRFEGWGIIDAYAAFLYLRDIGPMPSSPYTGQPAYFVPNALGVQPPGTIRYKLDDDAHVTLQVFDVRGRLVRQLLAQPQSADVHMFSWNGLDDQGAPVGSGVFFVRMRAQSLLRPHQVSTFTRKLIRLD